jgi:hypothetical protein
MLEWCAIKKVHISHQAKQRTLRCGNVTDCAGIVGSENEYELGKRAMKLLV